MVELIKETKLMTLEPSSFYFAVKSQNELYYQMASIFQQVNKKEDFFVREILSSSFKDGCSDFCIGN